MEQNKFFSIYNNNNTINDNNLENDIESIFQSRQETFYDEENFSRLKENEMQNELLLRQNKFKKLIMQKRLKNIINTEETQNLKSKLIIPVETYEQCNNMEVNLSQINNILNNFHSDDMIKKYICLVGIKKLLSLDNSPIEELININIIPELILILNNSPFEFQYQVLCCLTNVTSDTKAHSRYILDQLGIQIIIKLLNSNIEEIKLQIIWLIGNLANNCVRIRNDLIKEKIFNKLMLFLSMNSKVQIIRKVTWTIRQFFTIKPKPSLNTAKKCLKALAKVINIFPNDNDFLIDASFILSLLVEYYKEITKDLLELDLLPIIINKMDTNNNYIQFNFLRIVGNVACGNANQTQKLVDLGILNHLKKTIFSTIKKIRKESVFIISNIAAGTQKQIETLIKEDFLPLLIQQVQNDEFEIKKECIWAICNLTSVENFIFIKKILQQNILPIICEFLKLDDAKFLAVSLEALQNLLFFGKKFNNNNPSIANPIVEEMDKMGMFDILEKLQLHPVEIVYEKTLKILETFFETKVNE